MSTDSALPDPAIILVFCGKRKSGKDYVTEKLKEILGVETCEIMRLSGPLKKQYALEHGLDYEKLLDSSEYKEKVRVDMIAWGEARRNADPSYFCRLSTPQNAGAHKPVWIISDARRRTDIHYFRETYPDATVMVRVMASLTTRVQRGFVHTTGVDDAPSECDLDTTTPDKVINNDGGNSEDLEGQQKIHEETLNSGISDVVDLVRSRLLTREQCKNS